MPLKLQRFFAGENSFLERFLRTAAVKIAAPPRSEILAGYLFPYPPRPENEISPRLQGFKRIPMQVLAAKVTSGVQKGKASDSQPSGLGTPPPKRGMFVYCRFRLVPLRIALSLCGLIGQSARR
jgi:hypothetical protein